MPKPLSVLTTVVVVSACTALVLAQEAAPAGKMLAASATADETQPTAPQPVFPSEAEKPSKPTQPAATPAPLPAAEAAPTPKPHKPSWFERLFGSRKRKPTPTPAPTPTPPPHKSTRKHSGTPAPSLEHLNVTGTETTPKPGKPTPTPKRTEKPGHGAKLENQLEATPKPENPSATPKVEKPKVDKAPPATPAPPSTAAPSRKPPKGKPTATPRTGPGSSPAEPPADADPETKEKFQLELAKSKALGDPEIISLKAKADNATTDEESRKALRIYNKALFDKIRKIDPSVSERADRLEELILKRLNE